MSERLGVVYDGNLATQGKLDFYEFGRASYGFARFISTVERFRRTNHVPKRIMRAQELGVIIEAPHRGSFPVEILVPVVDALATGLANVPLEILVQYIVSQVQRIYPGEEQALLQAAQVQLNMEKERTKQSKEETKRTEAMRDMVKDQNLNQRLVLKMLREAQQTQSKVLSALEDFDINALREKLELMERREKAFDEHLEALESIPSDKLIRLTSKVRPQIAEMGLPLRGSATVMEITSGKERKVIAKFDKDGIKDINSRELDEEVKVVEASFRAYDRDTGIGKFDLPEDDLRRLTFSVPVGEDAVHTTVRFFRDKGGTLTSAIVQDVDDGKKS